MIKVDQGWGHQFNADFCDFCSSKKIKDGIKILNFSFFDYRVRFCAMCRQKRRIEQNLMKNREFRSNSRYASTTIQATNTSCLSNIADSARAAIFFRFIFGFCLIVYIVHNT